MTEIAVVLPTRGIRPATARRSLYSVAAQFDPDRLGAVHCFVVLDGTPVEYASFQSWLADLELPFAHSLLTTAGVGSGAAVARNVGLLAARAGPARYLAFLDDDDEWVAGHLTGALARLEALRGPGFAYGPLRDGLHVWSQPRSADQLANFLYGNAASTQTIVLNREALESAHFDPAFVRLQDWDFCLGLLIRGAVAVYDAAIGACALNDQPGISRGPGSVDRHADATRQLLDKYGSFYRRQPLAAAHVLWPLVKSCRRLGRRDLVRLLRLVVFPIVIHPGRVRRDLRQVTRAR